MLCEWWSIIIFDKGLALLTAVVKSRNTFYSTLQHFLISKISVDKLGPLEKTEDWHIVFHGVSLCLRGLNIWHNLKLNYRFCFLKNMNSTEQAGHQISELKQSFVSKNCIVRNCLTMISVTWEREISLDLAIGFASQCSWAVCQCPFVGTLHWTVLL